MAREHAFDKTRMVASDEALPGRATAIATAKTHAVNGHSLHAPFPAGMKKVQLGMGCFWGAERLFWKQPGVYVTAVGYAGGYTPNPTYEEVCSGKTGHSEVVLVVYDPKLTSLQKLLTLFCEEHDPTQGMKQGLDIGTNYRSVIYIDDASDLKTAQDVMTRYSAALHAKGFAPITTEIAINKPFYYAEDYHQQYLDKNPNGYCGLKGTGISCAIS